MLHSWPRILRAHWVEVELQGMCVCGELTQVLSFDEDLDLGGKSVSFGFLKWFYPYVSTKPTVWDIFYVPHYNLLVMLLTDQLSPVPKRYILNFGMLTNGGMMGWCQS